MRKSGVLEVVIIRQGNTRGLWSYLEYLNSLTCKVWWGLTELSIAHIIVIHIRQGALILFEDATCIDIRSS